MPNMTSVNANYDVSDQVLVARWPQGGFRKRAFDVMAASLLLLLFLPLMFFIAVVLFSLDRGSVFFAHNRVGYRGRSFRCFKFRTMVVNAEAMLARHLEKNPAARQEWEATQKLRDDPRVTPLGRFLRATSLDELPQLFNVIAGDMSLVGPRPIVEGEIVRYGSYFDDYASARPGLTGLWQVSGRSDVDYDERVALDRSYVTGWSLSGDLMILLRTVKVVFSRAGSY
jgi:lipopolysaccharide/colanic/teichoic acid biosynthesis glycosyltransferase